MIRGIASVSDMFHNYDDNVIGRFLIKLRLVQKSPVQFIRSYPYFYRFCVVMNEALFTDLSS